jgi:hypothetical protein
MPETMDERLRSIERTATKAALESAQSADLHRDAEEMIRWIKQRHEAAGATPDAISATVRSGGTSIRLEVTMGGTAAAKLYGAPGYADNGSRKVSPLVAARRAASRSRSNSSGSTAPPSGTVTDRLLELLTAGASRPRLPSWMEAVLRLDENGQTGVALDELLSGINSPLAASEFEKVDRILAAMPVEGPSLSLMMGLLSITRPASTHLPSRALFFARVHRLCKAMRRDAESLLGGLR